MIIFRFFSLLTVLLWISQASFGQESETDLEPVTLPGIGAVVTGLASGESAAEQRSMLINAWWLLAQLDAADGAIPANVKSQFGQNAVWLGRLDERIGALQLPTLAVDPVAWMVEHELLQHGMRLAEDKSFAAQSSLLDYLFDQSQPDLASALAPQVHRLVEDYLAQLWPQIESRNEAQPEFGALLEAHYSEPLKQLLETGSAVRAEAEAQFQGELFNRDLVALIDQFSSTDPAVQMLAERLLQSALQMAPPVVADEATPVLPDRKHLVLSIVRAYQAFHAQQYLNFATEMTAVTRSLQTVGDTAAIELLKPRLEQMLTHLSVQQAKQFAEVDVRINQVIAVLYDMIVGLSAEAVDGTENQLQSLTTVGNAMAKLDLLLPDPLAYYQQPPRQEFSEEIDLCTSIMALRDGNDQATVTQQQFEGCLDSFVKLSEDYLSSVEIAGDGEGPFGVEQLGRELTFAPWQRVNYLLGYLDQRYNTACATTPQSPIANPLEWSFLAVYLRWLANQSPVYFRSPENEARLQRVTQVGQALLQQTAQRADCISGSGNTMNDPITRGLLNYRSALVEVLAKVDAVEQAYKLEKLAAGADIELAAAELGETAYRPADLTIKPCSQAQTCGMDSPLGATRALVGLFPSPYLIADQTKLGRVELCYASVGWVQRRGEFLRADDPRMSNYHGKLRFDLLGRYQQAGEVTEVFKLRFTDSEEQHYLFAETQPEVLAAECPQPWVDRKIVVDLPKQRFPIVPNRLTYLSAARTQPARLMVANWEQGQEWRDRFVTGIGIQRSNMADGTELITDLSAHLGLLEQELHQRIYELLINKQNPTDGEAGDDLLEALVVLDREKQVVERTAAVIYPQLLNRNELMRSALFGNRGLVDSEGFRHFRDADLSLAELKQLAQQRVQTSLDRWQQVHPVTRQRGLAALPVARALVGLHRLQDQYFSAADISTEIIPESGDDPAALPAAENPTTATAE